ncbi:MAG: ribonuclease P protein component [Balneolaceae bacterium]
MYSSVVGLKDATSLLPAMKKGRNSHQDSTRPDQTLPKSKILRGKRNFEQLFERSTVLKSPSVHLRYRLYSDPSKGCLMGFIAGKRLGNAVTRNRIKRLLREVYRTHQHLLTDLFEEKRFGFHAVLMAMSPDVSCQELKKQIVPLLHQARRQLLAFNPKTDRNT